MVTKTVKTPKLYESTAVYFHGVCFTIRRVNPTTHRLGRTLTRKDLANYCGEYVTVGEYEHKRLAKHRNPSGVLILSYNGKYLARLHSSQLKKWCAHYALNILKSGKPY